MKKPTEGQYELAKEVWLDFCEGSLASYAFEPHPFQRAYEDYQDKHGEITSDQSELLDLIREAIVFGIQATGYESETDESFNTLVQVCRNRLHEADSPNSIADTPGYIQLEIPGLDLQG